MTFKPDLKIKNHDALKSAIKQAKQQGIVMPTFAQMINPEKIPAKVRSRLREIGLWDLDPANLFRINWHNTPSTEGGEFGEVNYLELPSSLTGVSARIIVLLGKWFPTGTHKVGAAYGCLAPQLVTGGFDPARQKAVWPSTGNYCRGGAYDSNLLSCESIAILPEGMSQERFAWLDKVAGETIKTPGSESNVKEIFDKCNELRHSGQELVIFNQFDEFGNYIWHYEVTGRAMLEVLNLSMHSTDRYQGVVLATGSGGTLASGDYLKQKFPASRVVASEALQCPTLLNAGFGSHRIEGIGDKHIPWIHNVKNTDMVVAIDDEAAISLMRLFNEPEGQNFLARQGVDETTLQSLDLIAISGIANVLAACKMAKFYEMTEQDVILTVATDSMEMYQSRLQELRAEKGEFSAEQSSAIFARYLLGNDISHTKELGYYEKRHIHNLKYYTWIEQQGKEVEELNAQWYEPNYWTDKQGNLNEIDALINAFNEKVLAG